MKKKLLRTTLTVMILASTIIATISCASSKTSTRKWQDRRFRLCQDFEIAQYNEINKTNIDSVVGKICSRECTRRAWVGDRCDKWDIMIKDLTKETDFHEFRAAAFVIISEDRIK